MWSLNTELIRCYYASNGLLCCYFLYPVNAKFVVFSIIHGMNLFARDWFSSTEDIESFLIIKSEHIDGKWHACKHILFSMKTCTLMRPWNTMTQEVTHEVILAETLHVHFVLDFLNSDLSCLQVLTWSIHLHSV